ncbi:50S ribosomal protein L15 [Armatimonas sp.]|uniref:50S ribosomal protein L15 n=1 Tax=Armatimonas sp. TaxID=1872638 RepID=UPI00286CDCB4|nr:50S ribosomal protein L15 [Armatimonas sp.]
MNLSDLSPSEGSRHRRKRIGRGVGSGHGKTSTHGHKGDKARGTVRPGFEGGQTPLHRRLPKQRGIGTGLTARGFNNGRFKTHYNIVNLGNLDARFEDGATVDPETVLASGLVRSNGLRLKVLAEGTLTKKLTIKAHKFSGNAQAAIEAAGGTSEVL